MSYENQILTLVKKSPVQPVQVAKALNTNSLMASAILSELSSKGKLKVSYLKVGSSPLYYDPENPSQLQNFVYALNEKEKRAYEVILQKKVIPDDSLDPLMKVCMRQLKDFAQPIEVIFQGNVVLFWKWYLLKDEDVESYARPYFSNKIEQNSILQLDKSLTKTLDETKKEESIKESQNKTNISLEEQKSIEEKSLDSVNKIEENQAYKKTITKKLVKKKNNSIKDLFFKKINYYFSQKQIVILNSISSKRNKEYEFILQKFDGLKEKHCYCKAVKKRKVQDIDVALAFANSKIKNISLIFLYQGELSKSAKVMLEKLPEILGEKL
ncbi:hypothetical protein HYV79_02555 [Candidatus Woesearchaeota archaeon]|nr:hypothetical protein [Candidatus Woesearchaeota archaeon]